MSQPAPVPSSAEQTHRDWARQVIHGEYHPHIDGLRCLAVLPVFLYHLQMSLCPAGFLGVDVFFVISGYLICGGILRDLQAGKFSMRAFYFRRIRRIFPAYFAVVVGVLLMGVAVYHWARLVPLAQTALFSALFSSNLYFWLDMGYFQPNAHANALLNLWSLGVEEQFYIIIPLALLVIWKIRRALVVPVLLVAGVGSLALCVWLGHKGQSTTAFYILPTRGWELLAGALLAAAPAVKKSAQSKGLAALGLALVVLSFWSFSTAKSFTWGGTKVEIILPLLGHFGVSPFPGWVNLPVILGSLLLLRHGDAGLVGRLLGARPLVGVGKISYSLYLWHWPVIVFARYLNYEHQGVLASVLIVVLSFLFAWLSWRWIEMPVRLSPGFTARRAFVFAGAGVAMLVAACALLIGTQGFRERLHQRANAFAFPPRPFLPNLEKLAPRPPEFQPPPLPALDARYVRTLGRTGAPPTFCLVGDSHAEALAPGLDAVAAEQGRAGLYVAFKMHPYVHEGSASQEQRLLDWVAAHPDVQDVYLVARWVHHFRILEGLPKLGDKGRVEPVMLPPANARTLEEDLRRTAQWFVRHGKRVLVFTTVPEYGYAPVDIVARSQIVPLHYPVEISRTDYQSRQGAILGVLGRLEKEGLFTVIPLHAGLFAGEGSVFMSADGKAFYSDGDHLTPDGARRAAEAVAPWLWR